MKKWSVLFSAWMLLLCVGLLFSFEKGAFAADAEADTSQLLGAILKGVEKRYNVSSFSADFRQESTLKVMEITDVGKGRITVKRPWMMKWEYDSPERQIYVTDGTDMWIYRPDDNQVQIGKADNFFTGVVRAVFLLDIEQIKKYFDISLIQEKGDSVYTLKLLPKEEIADVTDMYLSISKKTFDVVKIVKYNASEDVITYELSDFTFNKSYPDSMFHFKIPKGADVQIFDNQMDDK